MEGEFTFDELRLMTQRAGLKLTDDELERLLPGVNRARKQAGEMRALISLDSEPAGTFNASRVTRK